MLLRKITAGRDDRKQKKGSIKANKKYSDEKVYLKPTLLISLQYRGRPW